MTEEDNVLSFGLQINPWLCTNTTLKLFSGVRLAAAVGRGAAAQSQDCVGKHGPETAGSCAPITISACAAVPLDHAQSPRHAPSLVSRR